jgi:RNA polymerase sigma factor (sigma-70 family)
MAARQALREPFEQIAEKSRRYLYLVALRILGNRELAEDAVQDALLKAWQELLKQFETRHQVRLSGLSSWLHTIARHAAIDILKRKQQTTSVGLLSDIPERHYSTTHPFRQPETALLHKESQAELWSEPISPGLTHF